MIICRILKLLRCTLLYCILLRYLIDYVRTLLSFTEDFTRGPTCLLVLLLFFFEQ